MLLTTGHARLHLANDEVARLEETRDSCLEVIDGFLWLTVDGETVDHVLKPGESWCLGGADAVTVSAIRGPVAVAVAGRAHRGDAKPTGREAPRRAGGWRSFMARVSLGSDAIG